MRATGRLLLLVLAVAAAHVVSGQALTTVALVVTGGTVVTVDPARRVIPGGAVAIDGTRIVAVGPAAEIAAAYRGRDVIDATGQVVMPGLVNTHTHAPMVLYRGLADDLALMDVAAEVHLPGRGQDRLPGVRAHRHAPGGARDDSSRARPPSPTCITSRRRSPPSPRPQGCAACWARRSSSSRWPTPRRRPRGWRVPRRFIARFKGDALITPAVAPHALYTLDQATLLAARDLAAKREGADAHPSGRNRGRGDGGARALRARPDRLPGLDWLLHGARHAGRPRRVGQRRRHRHC